METKEKQQPKEEMTEQQKKVLSEKLSDWLTAETGENIYLTVDTEKYAGRDVTLTSNTLEKRQLGIFRVTMKSLVFDATAFAPKEGICNFFLHMNWKHNGGGNNGDTIARGLYSIGAERIIKIVREGEN